MFGQHLMYVIMFCFVDGEAGDIRYFITVLYPRLYYLDLDKQSSVATKLRDSSLISSFKRPRGGIEEEQLKLLVDSTSSIVLPQISDRWIWMLDSSREFLVKSAQCFIDDSLLPKAGVPTRWVNVISIKINIFSWRVCFDKLPTRLNLSLRGIDIPSILCPFCNIVVESTSHLILSFHLARQLMLKVAQCTTFDPFDLSDSSDIKYVKIPSLASDDANVEMPFVGFSDGIIQVKKSLVCTLRTTMLPPDLVITLPAQFFLKNGGYGAGLFWGRWGIMGRSGVRVVEEWKEWWGCGIIG
nr:RNA-directed DNA polymerase, eukaryota [Tanacetum cinerariifolium]